MEILETLLAELGVVDILSSLDPTMVFPIMMVMVVTGFIIATCSSRLLAYAFKIAGTLAFGIAGWAIGDILFTNAEIEVEGIIISACLGFIVALIGLRVGTRHPKFMTFVVGAGVGYIAGSAIVAALASEIEFLSSEIAQLLIPVVCAIVIALLCVWLFKFIYIFSTSMLGMIVAFYAIGYAASPENATMFALVGVIAGIFAMVHQYKQADF